MTKQEHNKLVDLAKNAATDAFNAQPFEIRKKLANGYDRLHEINLLLSKGDSLNMQFIKERKRNLEEWLLDWYKEQKGE
jgi:hypothetical protein